VTADRDSDDLRSEELEGKVDEDCNPVFWLSCWLMQTNTSIKSKFMLTRSLSIQELTYLHKLFELSNYYSMRQIQLYLSEKTKCNLFAVS
jgi:hypothetical protein